MRTLVAPRWVYFVLFSISGFAGLIYESIWSHYLKLFLGHAAYAQSLVLIIFMGGLALGSWLTAQRADRWRLPILGYAVVEGLIGILALIFHPAFVSVTDTFYSSVLPGIDNPTLGAALKWAVAALLMMPQSILLGMTFPLMTGGVIRRYPESPGGTLSMLYFTNSIGAAVGVLASGFWFIELLGLPGTMRLAGIFNIALALAVGLLVVLDPDRSQSNAYVAATPATADSRRAGTLFLVAAFVTGAASFIYEVGWLRMLSLVLGSTTHSFELMLSAFIAGLAFGGLYIRRHIDRIARPLVFAAWVQVGMGAVAALSLPIYASSFDWMAAILEAVSKTTSGYVAFTLASHGIAVAVMLPTTFLAGMTLPLFTHVMMKNGAGEPAIGRVYAANTLGAIAGVMFAMHVGMPYLGVKNLIAVGALLDVGLGLFLLTVVIRLAGANGTVGRSWLPVGIAAASGIGAIVVVMLVTDLRPGLLSSGVYRYGREGLERMSTVDFYRDGKTASIAVRTSGQSLKFIATNGKPDASIETNLRLPSTDDEITMVMAGSLPFAYKQDIRRVANIGLGSGLTTHTLLGEPSLEVVDTIEIEPAMVAGARNFGASVERAFTDPRSFIHIEDAKAFFPLNGNVYDVIVAEPSNPWVSGVSSLFSEEFYGLVNNYLTDDGLMVQWLQFYEFNDELYLSILQALAKHFGDFAIYNNQDSDGIIIAKKTGKLSDPDYQRVLQGAQRASLARVGLRNPADLALRRIADRGMVEPLFATTNAPPNSDYFPYVDLNAGVARFRGDSALLFVHWAEAPLPIVELLSQGGFGARGALSADKLMRRATIVAEARALLEAIAEGQALPRRFQLPDLLQGALVTAQMGAKDCGTAIGPQRYQRLVHPLMEATLPFLEREDSLRLVSAVFPEDCAEQWPAESNQWVSVYKAVATRDLDGMTREPAALLQNPSRRNGIEGRRQAFLFGSALLGQLAQGRSVEARNVWQELRGSDLYVGYRPPRYVDALLKLAGERPPKGPPPPAQAVAEE